MSAAQNEDTSPHTAPHSGAKTIVITGATGGVGRGIAIACGQAGWRVWIAARREKEGLEVAREVDSAGGSGRFVACDAGDEAAVADAIRRILKEDGRLDDVVHNATSGLSPVPVDFAEVSLADLQNHLDVALRAAFALAKESHAALAASCGSFLILTSEAGFEGKAKLSPYAGVKGAQRGFARALAREWGGQGIRVNALAPLAATPAMERAMEMDPELAKRVLGRNPMARLGDSVMDIGMAARFLLSDDSRYVTGHTLMVDGGSCPAV